MKIEIWGTYPPPYGGVSIHIYRFFHTLMERKIPITLKDFNGTGKSSHNNIRKINNPFWEFIKLPFEKQKIIHLHSRRTIVFLFILVFGFKHKIILTVHGKTLLNNLRHAEKELVALFLKRTDIIIGNDESYLISTLKKCGVDLTKLRIAPAYLKPLESERSNIPSEIQEFRNKTEFLISANASKLYKNDDGDVYGLDLLIELISALRLKGYQVGLVFCLPEIGDMDYLEDCMGKIKSMGIEKFILIYDKPVPNGFQIWELSDLFIRPTLTDIEGISVKEALSFGTPVIASDVCQRPEKAVLFEKGNLDRLIDKTIHIINNYSRISISNEDQNSSADEILKFYKSLME